MATIGHGATLHKMWSVTRTRESIFMEYVYQYHPFYDDVKLYYDRNEPYCIEGGDIQVLSKEVVAIGISQRTEPDAIADFAKRLFKDKSNTFKYVLAIDIPDERSFMHLDTVMTQVDVDKFAVQDAGLSIKGVVLEPIASAKAVLDDSDRDAGVAMVDSGGGTTDSAIFHDRIIRHTSVLPLAGNAITNDIREVCNILKRQAESLKVKFGSCLVSAVSENDVISIPGIRSQAPREIYVRTLAGIIHDRTKMIMEQVDYEIKLSGFQKKLIAGIALTGGGAQLKNIKDLCALITGIDTRIGVPNEHLEPDSVSYAELTHPMYATGIGLVLYGLEEAEKRNREPRRPRRTRRWTSSRIWTAMPVMAIRKTATIPPKATPVRRVTAASSRRK